MTTKTSIYQFKVTLRHIRPPIWRRFQVKGDITFYKLHLILQAVMGWANSHLYIFDLGDAKFTDPETGREFGDKNAERHKLNQFVRQEKVKFRYEYDFGDGWEHELVLEKILLAEEGVSYPTCLKGKRACPPEDCGGVWGYMSLLEALQDPENEEHEEMMDWLGDEFDPEAFDLAAVNADLRHLQ